MSKIVGDRSSNFSEWVIEVLHVHLHSLVSLEHQLKRSRT